MPCLEFKDIKENPIEQFDCWFKQAIKSSEILPNAAVLSTVDLNNYPKSRIVLIKAYDNNGFVFFSDSKSQKIAHISNNNKVSLLFYWSSLEKQVKINGTVERISWKSIAKYILNKSGGIGSWIKDKTKTLNIRCLLEDKIVDSILKHDNLRVDWSVYRILPVWFEFWQGCEENLHEWVRYKKSDGRWNICVK